MTLNRFAIDDAEFEKIYRKMLYLRHRETVVDRFLRRLKRLWLNFLARLVYNLVEAGRLLLLVVFVVVLATAFYLVAATYFGTIAGLAMLPVGAMLGMVLYASFFFDYP